MDLSRIDAEKYTEQSTAIRKSQPVHDPTTAMDMRIVLNGLQDRRDFHASNVLHLEGLLKEQNGKWKDLRKALAAAQELVTTRPMMRVDINIVKERIAKCEEQGASIKRSLEIQRKIVEGTQVHIDNFDHAKLAQLEKDEAALSKVGL
jgi:uncharacterized protein YydD (DUF2326 family)